MARKNPKQDEKPVPAVVSTFQWLRKKWGLLVAIGFVLWQGWVHREHIAALPGISSAWNWISREPIPHADEKRFSILVANLVDDQNKENKTLVLDELNKLEGVQVLSLDREIKLEDAEQRGAEETGHKKAKEYLSESHAHVLLWGRILKHEGKTIPQLYWTTSPTTKGERYAISDFHLPEIFYKDLSAVLSLLALHQSQEFGEKEGTYIADKLKPFIEKVRPLAHTQQSRLSQRDRATVLFVLANSLQKYGEQAGTNQELNESISYYKEALKERTRDRVPLQWAVTQNNLGTALSTLGERENDTQRIEEAVAAFRDALKEYTRDRVPLFWAMTLNNLGNALSTLGKRENDTLHLEEAVATYRDALKERTRERVPLDWAGTQNNLGNALRTLGERENSTQHLEEAIAAFRDALKEHTRERVPLQWAGTQNNLGNTLRTLGERESDTQRLEEAVAAFRDALKECPRERVPLQWAGTQNNLGNALSRLGERENSTQRLKEAVAAYREALKERSRERVPLDWAITQNNLGTALSRLGERENGTQPLEEAVTAFRDALKERTRERVPLDWATTQNNLGNALRALGSLDEAVAAYRDALKERTRGRVPIQWAETQNNLCTALGALGERLLSKEKLCESLACCHHALEVFERSNEYYAERTRQNLDRVEATIVKLFGEKALKECRKSLGKK